MRQEKINKNMFHLQLIRHCGSSHGVGCVQVILQDSIRDWIFVLPLPTGAAFCVFKVGVVRQLRGTTGFAYALAGNEFC